MLITHIVPPRDDCQFAPVIHKARQTHSEVSTSVILSLLEKQLQVPPLLISAQLMYGVAEVLTLLAYRELD